MLTFNLTICAVVHQIVGNSNNNAEGAAGSTLLLVHGVWSMTSLYPLPDPPEPVFSLVGASRTTLLVLVKEGYPDGEYVRHFLVFIFCGRYGYKCTIPMRSGCDHHN